MESYITVKGVSSGEYSEKKSRFIATLSPCENEEEAVKFIDSVKTKYWDARHNVFAFCVDGGRTCRFSDDSEPKGTAGKPVLEVINGANLKNVAVVVTRYFGGILLGTGGLVRAYTKAAQQAVLNAEIAEITPCTVFSAFCEYRDYEKLADILKNNNAIVENCDFKDKVELEFAVKSDYEDKLSEILRESFSAKLEFLKTGEKSLPFPAK